MDKLRDEQKYMSSDLSNVQMRWHSLREEKLKASGILHKIKKADEEIVHLDEEKIQVELDEKVVLRFYSTFSIFLWKCFSCRAVKTRLVSFGSSAIFSSWLATL